MKRLYLTSVMLLSVAQAVSLQGAGASFPYPLYSKYFAEYKKLKNIEVNYQSIGSGGGQRQILEQTVDFGASDQPMNDKDLKKALPGNTLLHIPTALGAVVVTYNVPGLKTRLKFDGALLARVFMGEIRLWNDPGILKLNAGVKLPPLPISVARRADSSGTTFVFTDYLSKISPLFQQKVGRSQEPNWGNQTIGAKGNDGVTAVVKQTPGAIGYVELLYAEQNHLSYALIENKAGRFIDASSRSVAAAANGIKLPADARISITNTSSKTGYPISAYTYLLVFQDQSYNRRTLQTATALKNMLDWVITGAQKYNEPLGYARLPAEAQKLAKKIVSSMKFAGKPL
ncbi:phosphate ABC transporter substrate-binding protein PstS [Deinococcus roseus]|uniref:Phosphate-binding protein n=1 Tax=Deinococcus roseus TaxID=392414 RepID=A0ABQ2CZW3_9DEIO|nr:phosphate ABC transporter substrate-binding protein PstS [Deinococcus roseus]GGJ30329.1 phosphate-binding protein [Deinococcus roseus]